MIPRQAYQPAITKTKGDSRTSVYINKKIEDSCNKFDTITKKVKK
ncbi:hypothetical protein N9924_00925 [bacterium]|nr:hypothetical protein [bacterium]